MHNTQRQLFYLLYKNVQYIAGIYTNILTY